MKIGVVSTFNPDISAVRRISDHISHLDRVVVVDDGSSDSRELDQLKSAKVDVVRLTTNSGIATALNVGVQRALEFGADYVLTLDQDTVLDQDFVTISLATFTSASHSTNIGIVVSDFINESPSIPPRYSPEGFGLVEEAIQSGMLISRSCFLGAGGFDERLFIDCVDTEFCLRVRDFGWNIAVAPGSKIIHELGEIVPYRPFGLKKVRSSSNVRTFRHHAPFRSYYIVRNNIDLCLRYFFKRPRWVLSVVRRETVPQLKRMIGGPDRRKQFFAFAIGTFHGMIRQRGKIPYWLSSRI